MGQLGFSGVLRYGAWCRRQIMGTKGKKKILSDANRALFEISGQGTTENWKYKLGTWLLMKPLPTWTFWGLDRDRKSEPGLSQ